ncbi:hypothetical protein M8J76_006267 [Diaphorina citri]|nr:hypothetical protein M8J76_006267 [Diaphorina citri]
MGHPSVQELGGLVVTSLVFRSCSELIVIEMYTVRGLSQYTFALTKYSHATRSDQAFFIVQCCQVVHHPTPGLHLPLILTDTFVFLPERQVLMGNTFVNGKMERRAKYRRFAPTM